MTNRDNLDTRLPYDLYRAEQVRELDRTAIEDFSIPGLTLMQRAGAAAFRLLRWRWARAVDITVVCGTGNNGGDGFVVALLALEAGMRVRVLQLGDPERLRGDARSAADAYLGAGGQVKPYSEIPRETDLLVDAVLGTGLEREVEGGWRDALQEVNRHPAPVLALDIPSGLHSDSGQVLGEAVRADATISFIGLKQGLFAGEGPECCGKVYFDRLDVPSGVYEKQTPSARRVDWRKQFGKVRPRRRTAHKGDFGHVLVIGGDRGYSGATLLAGAAAARTGAGLVSLATHQEHAPALHLNRPELMCHGVETAGQLRPLFKRANVIAIGPGIGTSAWAMSLLNAALESGLPMVVDADALNLLALDPQQRQHWILTPHPGEAGRLLDAPVAEVQRDRFQSVRKLQEQYGGTVVLKGAGSLLYAGSQESVHICTDGNPGMASGGMGDVLTGIIAAFVAQGYPLPEAATLGVCLHAAAADRAAAGGERGLLASDLIAEIRALIN
jgi:NAD(P)H-hydrate epimerase